MLVVSVAAARSGLHIKKSRDPKGPTGNDIPQPTPINKFALAPPFTLWDAPAAIRMCSRNVGREPNEHKNYFFSTQNFAQHGACNLRAVTEIPKIPALPKKINEGLFNALHNI